MAKSQRGPKSRMEKKTTGVGSFAWNRGVKPPIDSLTEEEQLERVANKEAAEKRGITIEDKAIKDSSRGNQDEIDEELATDEFASFFNGEVEPKLLLTTSVKPCRRVNEFAKELMTLFPKIHFYKRKRYPIQSICKYAAHNQFTSVLVIGEQRKEVHGVYACHLPEGPSMFFRITSLKTMKQMQKEMPKKTKLAPITKSNPEVLSYNFDSKIGKRAERGLRSLFPLEPDMTDRRIVTFYNQRDFIFFRNYRYDFFETATDKPKTGTREIGPQFTLRLRWVHKGLFNANDAEYEFLYRPEIMLDRKVFYV